MTTTATASSAVGTYPITASGAVAANYTISYVPGTLTVTPAPNPTILSIKAVGNNSMVITWTSISNSVYRVQYKANLASTNWINLAPDVTATASTASFTDYLNGAPQRYYRVVLLTSATPLTPLVVVVNNASRVYGRTNPVFSGTITGSQNDDNIGATYATTATVTSTVGTYPITPALVDPYGRLGNYSVIVTNGTLNVTAAGLTVTANNASRAYGATNPAFGGTITGIQNGDNITASYATTATINSPAGTYPITPTLVAPAGTLTNYSVTLNNGTLTVTAPATPTILSIVRSANTNIVITWTSVSMHTFHKLAASSWSALEHALQGRLDSLNGRAARLAEIIQSHEDDEAAEALPDFVLPSREFFDNERALLGTLLSRLRNLVKDSKWNHCADLLRDADRAEPNVKVLLFTQYRATLKMLQGRLPDLFSGSAIEVIHGDIALEDRRRARIRFETTSRFLLSTEAGGEGVNLHRACHVMVNYDLPWNPMRLQQRIGRLDRYGQKEIVRVFNLRVPDSWDDHISTRILERLDLIQRTMALADPGTIEDYREMILGQVAEQIDASRLFPASQAGGQVSEPEVDAWVRGAVQSVERWRKLFDAEVGIRGDTSRLKPSLTSEHFKAAYRLATEHHGIPLRESRNSQNQFVAGVYNFDAPDAFRDPVFRPSRTMHVVFDREIFAAVGGQDLGTVRGQPIRPLLTGFGESFTDWLFQTAMQARQDESAFSLQAGKDWSEGPGWLLVYALRWLGRTRRLPTPDSLAACFIKSSGEVKPLSAREAMLLVQTSDQGAEPVLIPSTDAVAAARKCAQETLRDLAASRGPSARSSANLSLLLVASVSLPDAWYAENARDWIKSQLGSGPWGALTEEVSKRLFGTKGMVDLAELETIAQAHNVKPEEVHAVLTSLTAQPGPTVRRVLYRLDDPQHSEIPLDEAIEHLSQRESSPDHWRAWAQKIGVAWRWHKQA